MRRLLAGLFALGLVGAAVGCAEDPPAPQPIKTTPTGGPARITVGLIPILDVAPIYLGKAKGIFDKHNIDLTLETSQGGSGVIAGVVSGRYQFGFSNVTSLMLSNTQGVPLRAVAAGVSSTGEQGNDFCGVVVRADSPVTTAADLAGRRVAVNVLKNIADTTVRESVRLAGGDPAKVTFVEMPFPQMVDAVSKGDVDAAMVVEPFLTTARQLGDRVVAWNFADPAPDTTIAVYFTSEKIAEVNLELVKRFHEAMSEALVYASGHPDEVRKILPTYTKIDKQVAGQVTLPKWPAAINVSSVRVLAQLGQRDGLFSKPPDLGQLLS